LVKLHLLLPKPLNALLYHLGDCAHLTAGFVIIAQLVLLCLYILIYPILSIARSFKITQTDSVRTYHDHKSLFRLLVCQSRIPSILHIFLPVQTRCLCVFNSLSCTSRFSFDTILNQSLLVFSA
jgi:hypothetical protein